MRIVLALALPLASVSGTRAHQKPASIAHASDVIPNLASLKGLTPKQQIQVGRNLKQGLAPLPAPLKNGEVQHIVGGTEAIQYARPWMVSLQDNTGFHFCGGSLIAPNVVLTAAHCVPGGVDHVEIGRHNILSGDSTTTESIPVSSIISHNCYDEYTMTSDIALLILASNSNFAPVEYLGKSGSAFFSDADSGLPTVDSLAEVMGWGALGAGSLNDCQAVTDATSVGDCFEKCSAAYPSSIYAVDFVAEGNSECCCQEGCHYFSEGSGYETAVVAGNAVPANTYDTTTGVACPSGAAGCSYDLYSDAGWCAEDQGSPDQLMTVSVPIWDQAACNTAYSGEIDDTMLCAGYDAEGLAKDSCQGDSGGPLYLPGGTTANPNGDVLVGVVSWGIGCASGYPGVYARISEFADFINKAAVEGKTTDAEVQPTPCETTDDSTDDSTALIASDLCYDTTKYTPDAIQSIHCSHSSPSACPEYCYSDTSSGTCICAAPSSDLGMTSAEATAWCDGLLGAGGSVSSYTCAQISNNWLTDYSGDTYPYPEWTSVAEVCAASEWTLPYYAQFCCEDKKSSCYDPDIGSAMCFDDCPKNIYDDDDEGYINYCSLAEFGTECSADCTSNDKKYFCDECSYAKGFAMELEPLCKEFYPDVVGIDTSCVESNWECDGPLEDLEDCNLPTTGLVCDYCYNDGDGSSYSFSYEYDPARFVPVCEGVCFYGGSLVSVIDEATRNVKSVPLHSLALGEKVLAVNHLTHKETFSKVVALPHSASREAFIEVETQQKTEHGLKTRSLLATEHHTFPLCDTGFRKEVSAMDLKHGQCLLTEGGGKSAVTSTKRVPAKGGDETYTVVLEGADDLVVVGGIVTHARPSKPAVASVAATRTKSSSHALEMAILKNSAAAVHTAAQQVSEMRLSHKKDN